MTGAHNDYIHRRCGRQERHTRATAPGLNPPPSHAHCTPVITGHRPAPGFDPGGALSLAVTSHHPVSGFSALNLEITGYHSGQGRAVTLVWSITQESREAKPPEEKIKKGSKTPCTTAVARESRIDMVVVVIKSSRKKPGPCLI